MPKCDCGSKIFFAQCGYTFLRDYEMVQKTLLIVDDSRIARLFVRRIVVEKRADLNILEAPGGAEAQAIAENNEIDYFSVDYNMPGIDGIDLIKKLKEKYPDSKMALLTANIQSSTLEKTEELNVPCIKKPVTSENITTLLNYFDE